MNLDLLQWPAMALSVGSTWWLASESADKRRMGFWTSIAGNVVWTIWGLNAGALAVVGMQIGLAALNIRGILKN